MGGSKPFFILFGKEICRAVNREKEKYIFESSPVIRAIMSLALPSVFGQIILVIYNMADTYFVGLTGSDENITAVTVCMSAFMFLSAIANLFGIGGASVVSRMLGSGKRDEARMASAFAFWGCVFTAGIYSLGSFLFADRFIDLLGGSNNFIHPLAKEYLLVAVSAGGIVTATNTLLSHLIRAEGRSLQASLGIVIGGLTNIALDPLFMFLILSRGNEVLGAALATAASNVVTLIYYTVFILLHRRNLILSIKPRGGMFRGGIPRDVIAIGIPACLMTLCENVSYAVLEKLMSVYGTAAQAGIGVAKKVNMLAHSVVRGMAQGVLPLIGYNYASGNRTRMRRIVRLSAAASLFISLICMAAGLLFSHQLIGVFIAADNSSHAFGAAFLRILCIGAPFSAWAYTVISFFQATGHMRKSLVLALLRKGILDIPLMFVLNRFFTRYGLVSATPIADIVCCVTAAILFFVFLDRHGHDKHRFVQQDV